LDILTWRPIFTLPRLSPSPKKTIVTLCIKASSGSSNSTRAGSKWQSMIFSDNPGRLR